MYARPLFVRARETEHEKTSTLKFQKFRYSEQGFDPHKIQGDLIFMFNGQEWVQVDDVVLAHIYKSAYRF